MEISGKKAHAVAIVIPAFRIDLCSATPDSISAGQSSALRVPFSGGAGDLQPGIGAVSNGQSIVVSPPRARIPS